jgi:hypothetical protein
MKYVLIWLMVMFVVVGLALNVGADMLRTKTGRFIEGKFIGGTDTIIQFQTKDGVVEYLIEEILSITFLPPGSPLPPLPKSTPLPQDTPTPIPKPQKITLAPDTRLGVRMLDTLDNGGSRTGDWFEATLDNSVVVNEMVAIPKGTRVRGQVIKSEHANFTSGLVITLREIRLKQQTIAIDTTNYGLWDQVPETDPASIDSTRRRSRALQIFSETFIEFRLTKPVEIDLTQ